MTYRFPKINPTSTELSQKKKKKIVESFSFSTSSSLPIVRLHSPSFPPRVGLSTRRFPVSLCLWIISTVSSLLSRRRARCASTIGVRRVERPRDEPEAVARLLAGRGPPRRRAGELFFSVPAAPRAFLVVPVVVVVPPRLLPVVVVGPPGTMEYRTARSLGSATQSSAAAAAARPVKCLKFSPS